MRADLIGNRFGRHAQPNLNRKAQHSNRCRQHDPIDRDGSVFVDEKTE